MGVHSPQPATCLSSLVGGVIVGVHSPQPATCLSSLVGGVIVGVHIVPNRRLACRVL